ncbi:hypothetical protein MTR67_036537 [Solanum verrucosum]|uniref:S-protein homolog n=1 Tax=Solanum verrucosum TaxID=315347 RepID=A0AAF0UBY9_SOLVR|nr:hypothetical protein MTR67_036537 [Solanum verrucosum]
MTFPLIIVFFVLIHTANSFTFNPKYTLHIISNLPTNSSILKIHCRSGDDDLGIRTLKSGDQFDFSFHAQGNTLFSCSFSWGLKINSFDVFSKGNKYCSIVYFKNEHCYYLMGDDGFYFAKGNSMPQLSDFKFIAPWYD